MSATWPKAGEWRPDTRVGYVWAPSEKGGEFPVAEARGWGYYTGRGAGALSLPAAEAIRRQAEVRNLVAAAPDLYAALEAAERKIGEWSGGGETDFRAGIRAVLRKARGDE